MKKYFITESERKGTCYFEFQKGEFDGTFWLEDSLLLEADIFDELGLCNYFELAVPDFYYYGPNRISREQWKQLVSIVPKNSKAEEVLEELMFWAEECFEKCGTFSVLGI